MRLNIYIYTLKCTQCIRIYGFALPANTSTCFLSISRCFKYWNISLQKERYNYIDKHIAAEQTCAYRSLYKHRNKWKGLTQHPALIAKTIFFTIQSGEKNWVMWCLPKFSSPRNFTQNVSWSPHLAQAPSSWAPGCRPSDLTGLSANRMPQNSQGSSSSSLSIWPFGVNPIFRHTQYIYIIYIYIYQNALGNKPDPRSEVRGYIYIYISWLVISPWYHGF